MADVVIIGAGVIGCSTAYHLAQMGITDVVVVEMDQVGSGASGKSASMLSLQFGTDELSARLAKNSYERYTQFEDEIGVPIDFKRIGWLSLATRESAEHLLRSAKMLQSLDIRTDILTPEEIKQRYPEINIEDIVLGTWGPDDGSFDPHMIMWGYIRRAREMGVKLSQGVHAIGIRVRKGQVAGVVTDDGFVATRTVINAGGPWAIEIGKWVGVEIPIINSARSIVVTGPFPDIPSPHPFVEDVTAEWYFRPEGPGILMGMGTSPTDELDIPFRMKVLDEMIDTAVHRVPILVNASFLTGWTGVRPMTLDNRPILGPVPSVEGFILNCGWGGTGIIQAPMAGQLVSEYISNKHTSTMDIHPFQIGRFAGKAIKDVMDLRVFARQDPAGRI
ncbi:MAG: FAD-dependent oxidoreductase [Chloroflexota bacterium]|nr:FAD-dependent oxidoreductase [Chloroflexota bacterium]